LNLVEEVHSRESTNRNKITNSENATTIRGKRLNSRKFVILLRYVYEAVRERESVWLSYQLQASNTNTSPSIVKNGRKETGSLKAKRLTLDVPRLVEEKGGRST
jgi:hypothetical protein